LAGWITTRLPDAWFYRAWRKVLKTQQRSYCAPWDSTATYAEGEPVFYGEAYWESRAAGNTGNTPEEGAWWTAATDVEKRILFDQSWSADEIAAVRQVTERDPRKTATPFRYDFITDADGIWLTATAGTYPWVQFWPRCPEFTTTAWAPDETYAEGNLVFGEDGAVYAATEASTGANPTAGSKWVAVGFPRFLVRWIEQAVRVDFLRYDQQDDKADAQQRVSDEMLEHIVVEEGALQDQDDVSVRMRGYG
jgi:hypothetical protein